MLKENDVVRKLLNADTWHAAGYTGKGVTIALLDDGGDSREIMKDYFVDMTEKNEIGHATNVGFSAHEFAPEVKVIGLRSNQESFEWIKEHKDEIDLINVSQAGISGVPTPYYLQYESLGIPMICASGNDSYEDHISYPARYLFTIAIGATLKDGKTIAGYSNEGPMLDAVVPSGVYVQRDDGYVWSVSGTSFAAPTVCGLLACYIQWRNEQGLPKLKPEEARKFIRENCIDIREKGFDYDSGYGLFCLPKEIPIVGKGDDTMEIRPCAITMADYHHTAGNEKNADEIRIAHMNPPKNYGDIGYNLVVLPSGEAEWGRDIKYSGAHDPGPAPDGSGYTMNQRSFGVVCIGNFEEHEMSEDQYQGLLKSAMWVHNRFGLSIEDHHRHKDQYSTECPGKNFPWARLMEDLEKEVKGDDEMKLKHAVVYFTDTDFSSARIISRKLGGCAMYCRDGVNSNIHKDIENCEHPVIVGGAELNIPGVTNCCGLHAEDTAILAAQYAQTL